MSTYITKNRILDFTVSLKIQHRSTNTITSYTTSIQKLELFLGGSELTKEQMLSYKQWLFSKGFKQRTINTYLAAANYFCDVMGWADMKQISSANYRKLVYTAIQNNKERLAMMIQVLCHMDLRFCELEKLTVEALKNGCVKIVRKNKHKKIKIPDILSKDLFTYIRHEHITSGIIFRTSKSSPVDRSNFRKDIKRLCVLAGVEEEFGSIQHIKNVVLDEYSYYGLKIYVNNGY